jgi:hypothetical protein
LLPHHRTRILMTDFEHITPSPSTQMDHALDQKLTET